LQMRMVSYGFQWDVPVADADFDPVIPEDYRAMSMKMPAVDEQAAIQSLRLFAELMGRYPEKLDMIALMSETANVMSSTTPAAKKLRDEMKGLAPEDWGLKFAEVMSPFQGLAGFHMSLVGGKKDPAYYGQTVTPQDTDKVLMRWKVSDTEYRVIFGDLRTETITAEALADLEKASPK